MTIPAALLELQERISARADIDLGDEGLEKLYLCEVAGQVHLEFYGSPFEESFAELQPVLCEPEVGASLRSLAVRGPDEGANGTRNWDFTPLLEGGASFPALTTFWVEPTDPVHHNRTILARDYDEDGMIAGLLSRMPRLETLTVPSAPDARFFEREEHPLSSLRVDVGYDTQDFLAHFATSRCFPALRVLEYGDFSEFFLDEYAAQCTPYDQYEALFRSPAFAPVRRLVLRNPNLTAEQLKELKALRADLQMYVIHARANYVR